MLIFFPNFFIFFIVCACGLLWIRKTQVAEQQQMQLRHWEHARAQQYQQQPQPQQQPQMVSALNGAEIRDTRSTSRLR
jgi:hypothetical protein